MAANRINSLQNLHGADVEAALPTHAIARSLHQASQPLQCMLQV